MISTNTLLSLPPRSLTHSFPDLSTPGAIFLSHVPRFKQTGKEVYYYKFDSTDSLSKKPATNKAVFIPGRSNVDPYVHASNWLPKFKDVCKGYLARKKAEDLRDKHEAAQTIQRAWTNYMDPWMQIFEAIKPTFKVVQMDELKKYLRQCVIQIKKLSAERQFIESQLCDVENMMEDTCQLTDNKDLNVKPRRTTNMLSKLSSIQDSAYSDTLLKECMDIDIKGVTNVEMYFDPSSCENSKVNTIYELADKMQQRIREDNRKWHNLQEKCNLLEKQVNDLRTTNSTIDTTTKTLRGVINKHDLNLQEQKEKAQDYLSILEKMKEEKKNFVNKIKELEKQLSTKEEEVMEANQKCEYLEGAVDSKTALMDLLNLEKLQHEKKIKELEDKNSNNSEYQTELESTITFQKTKLSELKKRLSEQLKATEDELMGTIRENKFHLSEQNEVIESQNEKIREYEITIRRLEREIEEIKNYDASDDEINHDKEKILGEKLKNANTNIDVLREEMKMMEVNNDELQDRVRELQANVESANVATTEHRKVIERLKTQIENSKTAFNETELKLNRATRDRNFNHQKWTQAKEKNTELERQCAKMQEELNATIQTVNTKNREIESLDSQFNESKKVFENKLIACEENIVDLQSKLNSTAAALTQKCEELKANNKAHEHEIDKLRQTLKKKEIDIEEFTREKQENQRSQRKLQRRIEEQEEIQADSFKTITKLKDEIMSLQVDNDAKLNTTPLLSLPSPLDQRITNLQNRGKNITKSYSMRQKPTPNPVDELDQPS